MVDDDENLCANMRDVLVDKAYQVSIAYDSNIAIEKAWEKKFDVVIIDLKLTPLNGLETYLVIHDFRPNVVPILITGYPEEVLKVAGQAKWGRVYAWLKKPIDIDDLLALLGQIEKEKAKGILKEPE